MKILLIRFNMMPYTERFDDFEILTLRFTILRNCPSSVAWDNLRPNVARSQNRGIGRS